MTPTAVELSIVLPVFNEAQGLPVLWEGLAAQYNPETASYGVVRIGTVASQVKQGTWIYDRTAEVWVSHPAVGNPNPQYAAFGRGSRR